MTAVLHHVVIRCAACGKVLLEANTYAPISDRASGWYCADAECVAERGRAKS